MICDATSNVGSVVCSTGPSFAPHADLSYYLALCLNTVCGRWGRAGERAAYQNILLPAYTPRAQAYPPYPVFGDLRMRVHGMRHQLLTRACLALNQHRGIARRNQPDHLRQYAHRRTLADQPRHRLGRVVLSIAPRDRLSRP